MLNRFSLCFFFPFFFSALFCSALHNAHQQAVEDLLEDEEEDFDRDDKVIIGATHTHVFQHRCIFNAQTLFSKVKYNQNVLFIVFDLTQIPVGHCFLVYLMFSAMSTASLSELLVSEVYTELQYMSPFYSE